MTLLLNIVLLLPGITGILSLDCSGPVDIVVAVPGSEDVIPDSEFNHLEEFLIQLVNYYTVSPAEANIGLVIYGKKPVTISTLTDATATNALNARISLLSQRSLYRHDLSGLPNIPKAIEEVHDILNSGRSEVTKIGIVMTFGSEDATSSNPLEIRDEIARAANAARADGVHLFATSTGGTVPGFLEVTMDTCRLFSLGDYSGLDDSLLPYLASSTCYLLDDDVSPSPGACYPVVKQPPTTEIATIDCQSGDVHKEDPLNCAYFYQCPRGQRMQCALSLLFDPTINVCNHKDEVSCYSRLYCPEIEGDFPHPHKCNKFLSCSNGIPRVFNCTTNLVFNPEVGYCDHHWNYQCDDDSK